jgi:hypothetical protein
MQPASKTLKAHVRQTHMDHALLPSTTSSTVLHQKLYSIIIDETGCYYSRYISISTTLIIGGNHEQRRAGIGNQLKTPPSGNTRWRRFSGSLHHKDQPIRHHGTTSAFIRTYIRLGIPFNTIKVSRR